MKGSAKNISLIASQDHLRKPVSLAPQGTRGERVRVRGFFLSSFFAALSLFLNGCGKKEEAPPAEASNGPMKIRVGYIGLTCEAPIFTAVEKGFFKEENLDVELVKCEWANYKDVLALGGYDITHHLVMYFLKPIEQGLDVKFTAGIHKGCWRVQASTKGNIRTVQDLRGKR